MRVIVWEYIVWENPGFDCQVSGKQQINTVEVSQEQFDSDEYMTELAITEFGIRRERTSFIDLDGDGTICFVDVGARPIGCFEVETKGGKNMRETIDGITYDTETAERIAGWSNGEDRDHRRYLNESLYVTKSGHFFLAGEGGALSQYATVEGETLTSGAGIIPLDKDYALRWCDLHVNNVTEYKRYFEEAFE